VNDVIMKVQCARCGRKIQTAVPQKSGRECYACPRCGQRVEVTTEGDSVRVRRMRSYRVRAEYK
jgi:DNA-directed RNA polymerase subunit RPC12/RpoP